jgi:hypothetical protein
MCIFVAAPSATPFASNVLYRRATIVFALPPWERVNVFDISLIKSKNFPYVPYLQKWFHQKKNQMKIYTRLSLVCFHELTCMFWYFFHMQAQKSASVHWKYLVVGTFSLGQPFCASAATTDALTFHQRLPAVMVSILWGKNAFTWYTIFYFRIHGCIL